MHLIILCTLVLSRRFGIAWLNASYHRYASSEPTIQGQKSAKHILNRAGFVPIILIIGGFFVCVYLITRIIWKNPIRNSLFLLAPFMGYAWLSVEDIVRKPQEIMEGRSVTSTQFSSTAIESQFSFHIKVLICNILEYSFYAAILPAKVLKNDYIYFDGLQCWLVVSSVTLNMVIIFGCYMAVSNFYDLFLHTRYLGCWEPITATQLGKLEPVIQLPLKPSQVSQIEEKTKKRNLATSKAAKANFEGEKQEISQNQPEEWKHDQTYRKGSVVTRNGQLYLAKAETNTAVPGNGCQKFIWFWFSNPEILHSSLIALQLVIISFHLALLILSNNWITPAVLLTFSYYSLWVCITVRRSNLESINFTNADKKDS